MKFTLLLTLPFMNSVFVDAMLFDSSLPSVELI